MSVSRIVRPFDHHELRSTNIDSTSTTIIYYTNIPNTTPHHITQTKTKPTVTPSSKATSIWYPLMHVPRFLPCLYRTGPGNWKRKKSKSNSIVRNRKEFIRKVSLGPTILKVSDSKRKNKDEACKTRPTKEGKTGIYTKQERDEKYIPIEVVIPKA